MTADEEEARRQRLRRFLADEVWPRIPAEVRGHAPTKAEREELLGGDPAELVRAGYDAALPAYAALEHDTWPRARWLHELSALLEPGSALLDLGCATGVPTAAELARTFRVTGVDISPRQIEQARANVPGARFVCADLRSADFAPGEFHAVVSLYTFDHVPRAEHGELLERVRGWLRPGGRLLLCIEDADEPGRTVDWLGIDMHFSMFDADGTRRLVTDAGFVIERTAVETQLERGTPIPYTWVLARRADDE